MIQRCVEKRFALMWLTLLGCLVGGFLFAKMPVELLPKSSEIKFLIVIENSGQSPESLCRASLAAILLAFQKSDIKGQSASECDSEKFRFLLTPENKVTHELSVLRQELKTAFADRNLNGAFQLFEVQATSLPVMTMVIEKTPESQLDPMQLDILVKNEILPELTRVTNVVEIFVSGGLKSEQIISPNLSGLFETQTHPLEILPRLAALLAPQLAITAPHWGSLSPTHTSQHNRILSHLHLGLAAKPARTSDLGQLALESGLPEGSHKAVPLDTLFHFSTEHSVGKDLALLDGKPAITMALYKSDDGNEVRVSKSVREKVALLNSTLSDAKISILYDAADYIKAAESNVVGNVRDGIILTCVCILFFIRSIKSTLLVSLSIPVSLLLTIPILYALGISRNVMSLAGIALGVGVVVDATLSIINGLDQEMAKGLSPVNAAVRSAQENAVPIAVAVLTTFCVFAPIILLEGMVGDLFFDLSVTVIVSQGISFVCAIFIIPGVASWIQDVTGQKAKIKKKNMNVTSELSADNPFFKFLERLLDKRIAYWSASTFFLIAVLWSVSLLPPSEFLPRAGSGDYRAIVTLGADLPTKHAQELAQKVDAALSRLGLENRFITHNNDRLVADFHSPPQATHSLAALDQALNLAAAPYLTLVSERNALDAKSSSGLDLEFFVPIGTANRKAFKAHLDDLPGIVSQRWSEDTRAGYLTVSPSQSPLQAFLIPSTRFSAFWQAAFSPVVLGVDFQAAHKPPFSPLAMKYDQRKQESGFSPLAMTLFENSPLIFAESFRREAGKTYFLNGQQREKIEVALRGKTATEIMREVKAIAGALGVPLIWDADVQDKEQSLAKLVHCIAIALLLTLMLLYMQNRSIITTTIIIFTFIWGAIGAFPGLVIHKETLNASALVGFILLAGTIVNNGILLMDIVEKQRQNQHAPRVCCLIAARQRTIPVLVTALTTVLGMLPMVFETGAGSQLYRALSIVVVYGTLLSTPISLLGIPCLVMILGDVRESAEKFILRTQINRKKNLNKSTLAVFTKGASHA